jgi:transposase
VPYYAALRARVDEVPDATLAEHREWLSQTHGVVACLTTIWKTLKKLKLTRKKSRSGRQSRPALMSPKREQPGSPGSPAWT